MRDINDIKNIRKRFVEKCKIKIYQKNAARLILITPSYMLNLRQNTQKQSNSLHKLLGVINKPN
jgi:hypothetical protein